MTTLAIIAAVLAVFPALLYARNVAIFLPPLLSREGPGEGEAATDSISVLIPARNEERSIRACVESVLANTNIDLELIVLDDHSTDATASIVRSINDPRLRLETAPLLPPGWAGKQHACYHLSTLATKPILTFLDADVRLSPDALSRMIAFQQSSNSALVSGFPRQETGTFLEKLLIPLMHFILLSFLPLSRMRTHRDVSLGAGCGQWFLTTRTAYESVGGHAAVKNSFHDGVKLPRAYRHAGFMTDICDATEIATCRMYHSAGQVWNGLAKNAGEGLGSNKAIVFWTLLLGLGAMTPIPIIVRLHAAWRFRQSWLGAILHPLGMACLLGIQWYAFFRRLLGKPIGWKGRTQ